jgi:hypothetical protein
LYLKIGERQTPHIVQFEAAFSEAVFQKAVDGFDLSARHFDQSFSRSPVGDPSRMCWFIISRIRSRQLRRVVLPDTLGATIRYFNFKWESDAQLRIGFRK